MIVWAVSSAPQTMSWPSSRLMSFSILRLPSMRLSSPSTTKAVIEVTAKAIVPRLRMM